MNGDRDEGMEGGSVSNQGGTGGMEGGEGSTQ